jgi:hypothetical protein
MLFDVLVHNAFLPRNLLDLWEEDCLLAIVMSTENSLVEDNANLV